MSIVVEDIGKSFARERVLRGISFTAGSGELFGLIGPDAAGKTTLLRILATLLLPGEGRAWLNGTDVVRGYRSIRRFVGYMPGRFSLYHDLTVAENLRFFASVFNVRFDPNSLLISNIYSQIAPFSRRPAGKLSGGMKQKLALCCALIHKPSILLLDEPTTGVDAVSRNEFWEMLTNLKDHGITIMVSTPYMDEARRCERVALIQKGDIMQVDTPAAIVKGFGRSIFTVKSINLYRTLLLLRESPAVHSVYPSGQVLHFVPAGGRADIAVAETYLRENGVNDFRFEEREPDIEDCFMELMRQEAGNG